MLVIYDVYYKEEVTSDQCWIYHLDLPIWNFALFRFNTEMDYVIFLYSGLGTNHL